MFVAGSVLKGASVSRQMCNNTQRNTKKERPGFSSGPFHRRSDADIQFDSLTFSDMHSS